MSSIKKITKEDVLGGTPIDDEFLPGYQKWIYDLVDRVDVLEKKVEALER